MPTTPTQAQTVQAPRPPGDAGQVASPAAWHEYLAALKVWVAKRDQELAVSNVADRSETYQRDQELAEKLWRVASERSRTLQVLWNDGRADSVVRRRMSELVWDTSDALTSPARAVLNLVETCRLCDVVLQRMLTRTARPREADTHPTKPEGTPRVTVASVGAVTNEPATYDAVSPNGELSSDQQRVRACVAELQMRQHDLLILVTQCRADISNAPLLAVPDVTVLGPVPSDADVPAYEKRLNDVARAFDIIEQRYGQPMRERDELIVAYEEARTVMVRLGVKSLLVTDAARVAQRVLSSRPCDVVAARAAVLEFQRLLTSADDPSEVEFAHD